MNQSKFSLADVITLLAALAFGFVSFLGVNFSTLGDTNQSIIIGVIISVLLSGTALGAKWLKRTNGNFKTCFIWEMILLVLFTSLTVFFTYSSFSHYFVVSGQKEEIQSKLSASITQAENMFSEYETYARTREENYIGKLESVVLNKYVDPPNYSTFGFKNSGVSDEKQIQNKMIMMHTDLFPSNLTQMKLVASTWLSNSNYIVSNWKTIGVVDILNNVEQNSNEWLTQLVELSKIQETGEKANDFTYKLSINNIKDNFTTLDKPTPLSIVAAIVAYCMMLLSWIVSKRHSRSPGCKEIIELIFRPGKRAKNEL